MIEAEAANVSPQLLPQLQAIFFDPERVVNLKLKLAITSDVGEHFVKATYYLEGDGPLVLSCYEKLHVVAQACQVPQFPNVRAVAAAIAEENPAQNVATLEQQAKACVQPAIDWFLRKFNVQLYNTVLAFKAARYMCPVSVQWLKPTQHSVETLRIFPFLNDDGIINDLKAELSAHLAATEDVVIDTEERKVKWWHDHKDQLPHWASAAKKVLLVQPSSAAAERVFSFLNSSFNDQQEHTLVDYLQASVMTQYNKR